MFSFVLGVYLGVELLSHMITLFNLLKNCQIVFHSSYTLKFSSINKDSNFSIFSTTLVIICLFDYHLPSGCEVYLTRLVVCISLMANEVEHSALCLLTFFRSSLETCLSRFFTHFWKLVCPLSSCKSSLYVLDASSSSDKWFPYIPPLLWVSFSFL